MGIYRCLLLMLNIKKIMNCGFMLSQLYIFLSFVEGVCLVIIDNALGCTKLGLSYVYSG